MQLDLFDRKIIASLQEDARMAVAQVAERTALSATPVSRRIKRLEDEGVILGYAPVLDPRKLGFEIEAYVLINLNAHIDENITRFEQAIRDNPYVIACHAVTGDMDYLVHIIARDVEHLSQITLKTLVRIPGVRDVKSSIVLEAIKEPRTLPLE
ncbi:Lrp/AsnC family transcriptional regulator [Novosphingobium aerophilum]|uniref:Lrp/AsnC family transcriptional regulator n=1 Tax=Novosphingobium TaxID=165696 RepID=UPI0006C8E105|nr:MULTISPECIES: Lrp/AsnC family transcriptional regulator [unclassified Novosphingobium]KPH60841.1 AsnC family transcriptional regulator [Novosphingobium sp. ST904]MPS71028.1 Lrp/AsnC family transcriptional regulator [Novosphingobium sp.]TCM38412.1 AsnC family transcriptional regulator [Novosphingobium sp. ST904]WRT92575.1 Lrp/AsnC family transcriptional regulator [Novosphingobium sp. RL4]